MGTGGHKIFDNSIKQLQAALKFDEFLQGSWFGIQFLFSSLRIYTTEEEDG